MLRELNFQNFSFRDLVVLRPDGQPWAAALAASRSRSLPIEEGAVAAAAGFGAAVLSGPARNALTGEWSLMFLRAMDLPGLGPLVAVAEVPVPLIATLLAPIGELPGLRISVERADGRVLVALPHDEGRMGRPWRSRPASCPLTAVRWRSPGATTTSRRWPRPAPSFTGTSSWWRATTRRPPSPPGPLIAAGCCWSPAAWACC
ncbi:hypothetical protein ACFQY5_25495 [Paeniroseomonas aquatica]|uniref:hypothetical protein n=1 Tax=Paeniroseomonas aquatica TaxID=373043 RepID=UPI003616AAB2